MDDFLNQDMTDALNLIEMSKENKEMLNTILFQERSNKDREWDDDAITVIVRQLESSEDSE